MRMFSYSQQQKRMHGSSKHHAHLRNALKTNLYFYSEKSERSFKIPALSLEALTLNYWKAVISAWIFKMSQSTKRKHVTKEVLDEFELPKENQKIVKIVAGRGNNLHQVKK